MEDIFRKYLRNNNYSLGGTDVLASSQTVESLRAQDFNECENPKFHDCSENAKCFNLRGTYTCSCKEGYSGECAKEQRVFKLFNFRTYRSFRKHAVSRKDL